MTVPKTLTFRSENAARNCARRFNYEVGVYHMITIKDLLGITGNYSDSPRHVEYGWTQKIVMCRSIKKIGDEWFLTLPPVERLI